MGNGSTRIADYGVLVVALGKQALREVRGQILEKLHCICGVRGVSGHAGAADVHMRTAIFLVGKEYAKVVRYGLVGGIARAKQAP